VLVLRGLSLVGSVRTRRLCPLNFLAELPHGEVEKAKHQSVVEHNRLYSNLPKSKDCCHINVLLFQAYIAGLALGFWHMIHLPLCSDIVADKSIDCHAHGLGTGPSIASISAVDCHFEPSTPAINSPLILRSSSEASTAKVSVSRKRKTILCMIGSSDIRSGG
jgi:hypothetical protein